jgi:hypothetical protein
MQLKYSNIFLPFYFTIKQQIWTNKDMTKQKKCITVHFRTKIMRPLRPTNVNDHKILYMHYKL